MAELETERAQHTNRISDLNQAIASAAQQLQEGIENSRQMEASLTDMQQELQQYESAVERDEELLKTLVPNILQVQFQIGRGQLVHGRQGGQGRKFSPNVNVCAYSPFKAGRRYCHRLLRVSA